MKQEELKELMALLPSNIKTTKEFTTKTKMVIAQLILMNGLDKVKNDGYFFVTNQKLVEELGITEKTIIKIMRNLETNNFITRKSGKRGEASEYIVNEEIIKSFGNTVKKHCNTVKENTVINYSNDLENTVLNYSNKINDLVLIINDLVKSNQELINKVNQLEITVLNYSNKIQNYSTDTESDTDTDIEKEKELEIYNNIIIENINNKKEYIIEESEVIETSISENEKIENYEIEEVGLIENPTSNEIEEINPMPNGNGSDDEDEELDMIFGAEIIEENNIAFQLQYVGMQETKENNMNTSFEKNFNVLLNRLGDNCSSVEELEQKTIKLCGWVIKHQMDYNNEERQTIHNLIADKYDELKETIENNIKEVSKAQDEFFNNINLDPTKAKTVNQVKKENESVEQPKEITKEKLEKDINDFINSLPTYEDYSRATDTANYITKKFDKEIRQYGLMQLAMYMYTQINEHKNANKSDLTNLNNQDIETTINDEKTQEIASCEFMDDSNIEECIAALIEDLEPAVLESNETYIFETSTKLW